MEENSKKLEFYKLKNSNRTPVEKIYIDALKVCVMQKKAGVSMIQRECGVGYVKGAMIIDWLEKNGYVSKKNGSKTRNVYATEEIADNAYVKCEIDEDHIEALKYAVCKKSISLYVLQRKFGFSLQESKQMLDWVLTNGYAIKDSNNGKIFMNLTLQDFTYKFVL